MFSLRGFGAVSLSEIAGACGMSAAAIYNYFPSKDDLYIEIICTLYDEVTETFSKILNADTSLGEAIDRLLGACLEIYREDQVLARLGREAHLESTRAPDRFPQFKVARSKIEALFTSAVARAVKSGELPAETDIEETGAVLHSFLVSGIAARTLDAASDAQFHRTVSAVRGLFKQMLPTLIRNNEIRTGISIVPNR